jgi:RNA polymerase sigma factor (sigma-70 family)
LSRQNQHGPPNGNGGESRLTADAWLKIRIHDLSASLLRIASFQLWDQSVACDIVQEAYRKFLLAEATLPDSDAHRENILKLMVARERVNYCRATAQRAKIGDGKRADMEACFADGQGNVVEKAGQFDELRFLHGCCGSLNADEKEVVRLYYVDGQTVEQIGRIRNQSSARVTYILQRARAQLRRLVDKESNSSASSERSSEGKIEDSNKNPANKQA